MDRETKVEIVRKYLLPLLDQKTISEPREEEHVEKVEKLLAEAYLDESWVFLTGSLKGVGPIVLIDILYPIPAVTYGLVLSMIGTWFLIIQTDLLSRHAIASESEYRSSYGIVLQLNKHKAERLALNTVYTNIGLVWLSFGFLFQIIATIFFPGQSLVETVI